MDKNGNFSQKSKFVQNSKILKYKFKNSSTVLLVLFYIVDVWRVWKGAPLYYVGMNSMLLYLLHEILTGNIPWCGSSCTGLDTHAKQMASQIGGVAVWTCYSYYAYRNKFFLVIWLKGNKFWVQLRKPNFG